MPINSTKTHLKERSVMILNHQWMWCIKHTFYNKNPDGMVPSLFDCHLICQASHGFFVDRGWLPLCPLVQVGFGWALGQWWMGKSSPNFTRGVVQQWGRMSWGGLHRSWLGNPIGSLNPPVGSARCDTERMVSWQCESFLVGSLDKAEVKRWYGWNSLYRSLEWMAAGVALGWEFFWEVSWEFGEQGVLSSDWLMESGDTWTTKDYNLGLPNMGSQQDLQFHGLLQQGNPKMWDSQHFCETLWSFVFHPIGPSNKMDVLNSFVPYLLLKGLKRFLRSSPFRLWPWAKWLNGPA